MDKIKIYGMGGQGVVTAAKVLAHALSIYEGKYAKTAHFYGHERRGAPVSSDVMVDTKVIKLNSYVYNPNIIVLFDVLSGKEINIDINNKNETVSIINSDNDLFLTEYQKKYPFSCIYYINANEIAVKYIHKNIPNIPMLAAISKTGVVGLQAIIEAIKEIFGTNVKYTNMIMEAYERTKRW